MGIVMQKLVILGEYCDCLQNWRKFQNQQDENNQSSINISQNLSNIEQPLQKVFKPEIVENGFDKQLQILHERFNKRKKLKEEYIKQKQKQRIIQQKQEQKIQKQKIKRIERQKQLMVRQLQLKKIQQQQAQRIKKQKRQKKIRANKRNNRLRDRQKAKLDNMKIVLPGKQLSTTDDNILNALQNDSMVGKKQQQQQHFYQKQEQNQQNLKNQQQNHSKEVNKKIPLERQNKKQAQDEQFEYQFKSERKVKQKQKDQGLQIIDLSKLDPEQMKNQISQLVLKKLTQNSQNLRSQTVPLNQIQIKSHRVRGDTDSISYQTKGHLYYQDNKQLQFQDDEIYFAEDIKIAQEQKPSYFLDDEDKQEYFKGKY